MKQELSQVYRERSRMFQERSTDCLRRYNRLALVRLIAFVAGLGLVIYLFSVSAWLALGAGLIGVGGFYRLIQRHQRLQRQGEQFGLLARINAREAACQDDPFPDPEPDWPVPGDGAVFQDADHPYAVDLDLYGPYSLFAYANRCNTSLGRKALAGMLGSPAPEPAIRERQAAVREMAPQLEWRQWLETYGSNTADEPRHLDLLRAWLADEAWVSTHRGLQLAMYLNPLLVLTGLVLVVGGWVHWMPGLLFVLPAGLILRQTLERVNRTHRRTAHAEGALARYSELIGHMEAASWQAARLGHLTAAFHRGGQPASQAIRRLSYLIRQLNVRYNFFAVFLNLFALWDLHWIYRLEAWRHRHRAEVGPWFDALAEMEALSSLATLRFNHPGWTFPKLVGEPRLEAVALGHPLIPRRRRVDNDLSMPTVGHLKLITGSNMAGKSTFLRTVGLNIVLAMAGSCVCAAGFRLPRLRVYTSMRTQDALHESTSSFYAELKRLHQIIEAVEHTRREEAPVFFLLDEILKGTNSVDRHTGSEALLRQFIRSRAAGLVATHDLALGRLAGQHPGAIENRCMEVEIRDGELVFDYKLKPGVSQSFNATLLMRRMGIDIPADAAENHQAPPEADKDQAEA